MSKRGQPIGSQDPVRDAAIIAAIDAGRTGADLAREYGISRERVRQIYVERGGGKSIRHLKPIPYATCDICGEVYPAMTGRGPKTPRGRAGYGNHARKAGHFQSKRKQDALAVVVAGYKGGFSIPEIEVATGLHPSEIRELLIHAGVDRRQAGEWSARRRAGAAAKKYHFYTDEEISEVARLRGRGLSLREIGRQVGVGTTRTAYLLKKYHPEVVKGGDILEHNEQSGLRPTELPQDHPERPGPDAVRKRGNMPEEALGLPPSGGLRRSNGSSALGRARQEDDSTRAASVAGGGGGSAAEAPHEGYSTLAEDL